MCPLLSSSRRRLVLDRPAIVLAVSVFCFLHRLVPRPRPGILCFPRSGYFIYFGAFLDLRGPFHSGRGRCSPSGVLCIRCIGSASIAFPNKGIPYSSWGLSIQGRGGPSSGVLCITYVRWSFGIFALVGGAYLHIRKQQAAVVGITVTQAPFLLPLLDAVVVAVQALYRRRCLWRSLFRGDCNCGRCSC